MPARPGPPQIKQTPRRGPGRQAGPLGEGAPSGRVCVCLYMWACPVPVVVEQMFRA